MASVRSTSQYNLGLHSELHARFLGQEPCDAVHTSEKRTAARYNGNAVTLTAIVTVANTYFQILKRRGINLRVARRNKAPPNVFWL